MLVDDHVANFNIKRAHKYHTSDSICVDAYMSRWNGIGGQCINSGLPQYIVIDRKPENGCDIHNASDGVSGIMMQLKLVKTSSEEHLHSPEEHDGFLHGTKVILNIFQTWVNKKQRVVSADSYFALVQACDELKKRGLRFIGVEKKSTRGFCMDFFLRIELAWRGMWKVYFNLDKDKNLDKFAFVWVDRDRRYFIYNTPSLKPGMPHARDRLRQVDDSPNAYPFFVYFEINKPRVDEIYYSRNLNIDESNRTRQDDFQL